MHPGEIAVPGVNPYFQNAPDKTGVNHKRTPAKYVGQAGAGPRRRDGRPSGSPLRIMKEIKDRFYSRGRSGKADFLNFHYKTHNFVAMRGQVCNNNSRRNPCLDQGVYI